VAAADRGVSGALGTGPGMEAVGVGQVRVAWAATSPGAVAPALASVDLGAHDIVRASAFGPDRRRAFVVGRSLIAGLVGDLFPGTSGWSVDTGTCSRCGARHGAVEITGAPVVASVSYAPGLVVAAVATTDRVSRLGVDVEPGTANPTRDRDLQQLLGRSNEPALRRWTQVEAVLKADGRGLSVDPAEVRVRSGHGRIADDPVRYRVEDVAGPTGYLISLAWCEAGASAARPGPATG
jgi:4'-phosphopantetheinyl transferase